MLRELNSIILTSPNIQDFYPIMVEVFVLQRML